MTGGMAVATQMGYGMAHAYAGPGPSARPPGVCFNLRLGGPELKDSHYLFPTAPNLSKASADFSCLQGKRDNRNTNGHLWDASKLPDSAFIWKIQQRRQVERGW